MQDPHVSPTGPDPGVSAHPWRLIGARVLQPLRKRLAGIAFPPSMSG
jgi:hypothetical protein